MPKKIKGTIYKKPYHHTKILKDSWGRMKHYYFKVRYVGVIVGCISLIILGVFLAFTYINLLDSYETLKEERAHVRENLTYWENVLKTQKNSADIYFQAALYAYQLGDDKKVENYLDNAIFLDPSRDDIKIFKGFVEDN